LDPQELTSVIRIKLKSDGMLADGPMLVSGGNTPLAIAARACHCRA
jgi:hypothetical protein